MAEGQRQQPPGRFQAGAGGGGSRRGAPGRELEERTADQLLGDRMPGESPDEFQEVVRQAEEESSRQGPRAPRKQGISQGEKRFPAEAFQDFDLVAAQLLPKDADALGCN